MAWEDTSQAARRNLSMKNTIGPKVLRRNETAAATLARLSSGQNRGLIDKRAYLGGRGYSLSSWPSSLLPCP